MKKLVNKLIISMLLCFVCSIIFFDANCFAEEKMKWDNDTIIKTLGENGNVEINCEKVDVNGKIYCDNYYSSHRLNDKVYESDCYDLYNFSDDIF